jgi:tetratricopeptide (TPR) repeat protein
MATSVQAAEVARAVGDRGLEARAGASRGYTLSLMGRDAEGLPLLEEAGRLAEAVGDLGTLNEVLFLTPIIYEDRGEFDRARSVTMRCLALSERLHDPVVVGYATIRLAALAFFEGDWGQARRHLERLEPLPERIAQLDAGLLLERGRLRLAEGECEEAARYLEECSAIARHFDNLTQERVVQSYLAECDLLEGRPEMARARLVPLIDREEGVQEREVTSYVLPVLAWAHLELGDIEQAAETIEAALRRQRAASYRLPLVGALRVRALVALRQGDVLSAEQALGEGLALAQAIPYPHGEGRLLEVFGRLHLQRGEPAAGRERLEAAQAILRRLGASKDLERAEQLLTAAG